MSRRRRERVRPRARWDWCNGSCTPCSRKACKSELKWRKSSFSEGGAADCVEVATGAAGASHLRESDDPRTVIKLRPAPSAPWCAASRRVRSTASSADGAGPFGSEARPPPPLVRRTASG
ncbi:DUF397 domain-containing protein [Streptomyces sp. RPT161]|uniref:DUF397 domain-containing protein n=1 Tax=Streptomyces sp. RPT161 TaxID=3015993 RepID=UPI002FD3EEC6